MVIVIQYNVDVYDCGLRDLVPLIGILSVFVIVRVYAGVIMGVGGDGMFAVVICWATPACGSGISRCRIQLLWILSLCATRAVSVNWCSGVLVWVCFWVL